ncbi:hypothetical protein Golob_011343 [Gossypium lobatum]|uniref:RNase H type-1 domain-containing protein n=1 Tax=Gossypium lobatum TaxID=34289 RepID=A0A7J8MPF6_9ROSI|nr:hypothetical protein [Gossypium lobatum]
MTRVLLQQGELCGIVMGSGYLGLTNTCGVSSVFDAKLWVILDGLTILINRGYDNVLIQSNSLEAVKDLQDSPLEDGPREKTWGATVRRYLPFGGRV